jgi:hypothetical protein
MDISKTNFKSERDQLGEPDQTYPQINPHDAEKDRRTTN